jgi:hypothetical protein
VASSKPVARKLAAAGSDVSTLCLSSQDALKQERFLREKYNITMVVETPAFLSFTQIQAGLHA